MEGMKNEIRQIVSEYRRFRETGRPPPQSSYRLPDGSLMELCHTNGCDWTLCVLRAGDGALSPVGVSDDGAALMVRYSEMLTGWDPALWPPISVVVEGVARVFAPTSMSLLLGVVEFGRGVLLLGVVKRASTSGLALLHVDQREVRVVHFGGPMDLRGVDVDGLLELQRGMQQAEIGVLDAALLAAFARLLARALKPRRRSDLRRRGTGSIHLFMWVIIQLVLRGADDLYGRLSDIEVQIKALLKNLDLPKEALGDNLVLLLATKTCLVSLEDRVMWRLRLSELGKVGSALYLKFCAEALGTVVDVDDFARICAVETPPTRAKYRGSISRSAKTVNSERGPADESTTAVVVAQSVAETGPPAEDLPVLLAFLREMQERTAGVVVPVSACAIATEDAPVDPPAPAADTSRMAAPVTEPPPVKE
jgi:hypothetical protein